MTRGIKTTNRIKKDSGIACGSCNGRGGLGLEGMAYSRLSNRARRLAGDRQKEASSPCGTRWYNK